MSPLKSPLGGLFINALLGQSLSGLGGPTNSLMGSRMLPPVAPQAPLGMLSGLSDYPINALAPSILCGLAGPSAPNLSQWIYVRRRFAKFLANITITIEQREDGERKQGNIRSLLNRHYWGVTSETANSFLIGSWGKNTRCRPSRDVDLLFLLPSDVYYRFEQRIGNKQSQLLQEIKGIVSDTYKQTAIRGDGQVVLVPFNTIPIEVAIGFRCQDGQIIVCDSNNGGFYKISTAEAEAQDINHWDAATRGNLRALVRMIIHWQREQDVGLKSFHIERLAIEFFSSGRYQSVDEFWYDWMVRDFFGYLLQKSNGSLQMPRSREVIQIGRDWFPHARDAYRSACIACDYERGNYGYAAGNEWQQIFGNAIPAGDV